MVKRIIKETIIILLLLCAIALILGIILYDYIPINKVVPVIEGYQTSESVKNEIKETIDTENSEIVVTYEMDSSDLKSFEKTNEYDKGKANPFSKYVVEPNENTNHVNNTTNNTSSNNTTNNTNNNTTNNTNKTGSNSTFFNDSGTK